MSLFLDYSPHNGVSEYIAHEDDKLSIHYQQDVEPILDWAKDVRNNGLADKSIRKEDGLWLYAKIPPVVILELRHKYGVDIFKKDHLKRAMQLIDQEYPRCKTTDKRHIPHIT